MGEKMFTRAILFSIILGVCLSSPKDEFARKRRIPYHFPGFWHSFLPRPMEDIKRYSLQVKRSGSRPTIVNEQDANGLEDNYWMGDEDDSGFLEDGKIPADGTLFGWDRRKRFVSH